MQKVSVSEKLDAIREHWDPRIVAELNGQKVMLAKLLGEFVWHQHEHEDELFYVLAGSLTIEFRDRVEILNPGEMMVVPRGVEHRPVARKEVHLMLFEPASTINTGNVENEKTIHEVKRI